MPQTNGHANGSGVYTPPRAKDIRPIWRPKTMPYDEWHTATLDSQAEQVQGDYGPQWRYFLKNCDGDGLHGADVILYANEPLQEAIEHSGARQGDIQRGTIHFRKSKVNRKDAWEVATHAEEPPQPQPHRPAAAAPRPAPVSHPATAAQALGRPPQPAAAMASGWPEPEHEEPPQPEAPQETPTHSQHTVHETALLRAYISACGIAAHAVRHAWDKHQLRITPVFEDIRSMAATLYIQQTGRPSGGARWEHPTR